MEDHLCLAQIAGTRTGEVISQYIPILVGWVA